MPAMHKRVKPRHNVVSILDVLLGNVVCRYLVVALHGGKISYIAFQFMIPQKSEAET
jgi:hypothetical protein